MYPGSSLPRLHHAHQYYNEPFQPIDTNAYDYTSQFQSYESDNEYESVTAAILSPGSDDCSDKDSDDMEPTSFNENNDTNTSVTYSVDSQSKAVPSQASRINAIAKLKRAASQREMKGRGDVRQPPQNDGSSSLKQANGDQVEIEVKVDAHLQTASSRADRKATSPAPIAMLRVEQLRSESISPSPGVNDGSSTPSSGEGSLLQRSRSQRGNARSPLPSLEQLRARILQERATAGLARSASTSAASAAARQYALEKLLGESPRQGAISPVSDTAEDREEETKNDSINSSQYLSPVKNQDQRPLLRRSRTIGGLTAAADAQRKAAFVQELDEGVPDDVKSGKRSSRRFAKAPLGSAGRSSTLARPNDTAIAEGHESQRNEQGGEEGEAAKPAATSLDRSQSQRQIARTEMMRKLSTRGRQKASVPPGQASAAISTPSRLVSAEIDQKEQAQETPTSPERGLTVPIGQHSPVTPPPLSLSTHLAPHCSPDNSMLTVPGSSPLRYSPSSRPSTGMTSYHEADRNRASEMARLNGEEAFEYEKLLEMGYSSDYAYERVASARSGSYVSQNASPALKQDEGFAQEEESPSREQTSFLPSKEEQDLAKTSSSPSSIYPNKSIQSNGSPGLAAAASIPLALASNRQTLNDSDGFDVEKFELLDGDDLVPMSRRRPAWPESVTSIATSADPFSSPRKTVSTGRGSEDSRGSSGKAERVKAHPTLPLSSASTVQRFEDILTPTFMRDFGDILDYSDSPIMASFPPQHDLQSGQVNVAAPTKESNPDGSDYLLEVEEMTQKLGDMVRRKNSTSRDERDALVQQSSAAQLQAAASDEARRDTVTSVGVDSTHTIIGASTSQDKVAISPTVSLLPLSGTLTPPEKSALPPSEMHPYIANGKLSPFPGLIPDAGNSPESSVLSLRMPSPLKPGKGERGDSGADDSTEEGNKAHTFLTSLRRKASNAAARVQRSNGDSPSTTSTKRFGSLLRRKPSESRRGSKDRTAETPSPSEMPLPLNSSAHQKEELLEIKRDHIRPPRPTLLTPASNDVLHRYSRMLTSTHDSSSQLDIPGLSKEHIEDPPRKLLLSCPVLQVMTASAVKDRFLFIFTDLLVIAKPISPPIGFSIESLPTLQWTFSVKGILEIAQMKQLLIPNDERRHPAKSVPLMEEFVHLFERNPEEAIEMVISKSNLPRSAATIAQILHQTPELDRLQLSKYLFESPSKSRKEIAKAFVELDKSAGVSIESALRSFLLEIRFPPDRETFEDLLVTFAIRWTSNNRSLIKDTFSEQLAVDLVFAIMALNDALHTIHYTTPRMFSQSMPEWSKEDFLEAFRFKDPDAVLSDRTITRIYSSISQEPLQQALLPNELGERIPVCIHSPGIPTRLTFGTYSNAIKVSIPRADPDFAIRLYGQDLAFSPQVLSFDKSRVQEFKVTSKSLGIKSIVFVRTGRNARFYPSSATHMDQSDDFPLPRSINIVIERAFKQHCFTLALDGPSDQSKMTFSVENDLKRKECIDFVKGRMLALATRESRMADRATEALALHVLREAIQEESDTTVLSLQRSASAVTAATPLRGASRMRGLTRAPSDARALESSSTSGINRNESVSRHYYQAQGKNERDLVFGSKMAPEVNGVSESKTIRGDDLVLTVRQNSLLSIVVAHLQQHQNKV